MSSNNTIYRKVILQNNAPVLCPLETWVSAKILQALPELDACLIQYFDDGQFPFDAYSLVGQREIVKTEMLATSRPSQVVALKYA